MADSITCRNCTLASHNPNDIKFGWCARCEKFAYSMGGQGPIDFNGIVGDLQTRVRRELGQGLPFSLQFEQFTGKDERLKWRALVKMGSRVAFTSRNEHITPHDAVHELWMIVDATRQGR